MADAAFWSSFSSFEIFIAVDTIPKGRLKKSFCDKISVAAFLSSFSSFENFIAVDTI